VRYTSRRTHRDAPSAAFAGRYRPIGPVYHAAVGSLEYWLTERYCLYAADRRGRVWRGDIHHARWPLQPAEADIACNTMAEPLRLSLPPGAPLLHFAPRLDVVAWALEARGGTVMTCSSRVQARPRTAGRCHCHRRRPCSVVTLWHPQ
jgi:uncharacterized protein